MPTSEWEDWLPRAVEAADPEGLSIWYLGCNGFILKDAAGTTLFIDPYLGSGDPPRTIRMIPVPFEPADVGEADALLVTHEHTDHLHAETQVPLLENTDATMYAPNRSIEVACDEESWADRWAIRADQFRAVGEGDAISIGAFDITVGPANDPDAVDPVSYVIEHPAGTVFHGGDTKPTPAFDAVADAHEIDVAIVAFGTVGNVLERDRSKRTRTKWYCDENEAVSIAATLEADRLLPSHWDMWKGLLADPTALHHHIRSWEQPRRVEIVEIGDRIDL